MTPDEIEAVFARVRTWPAEKQQEAVGALLAIENDEYDDCSDMTEEDWADLEEGLAELDRGELASEEEVKALFDLLKSR